MADFYIGLSGYSYKAWQGPNRLYPSNIKPSGFLQHYATRYRTVELDGLWYRLPTDRTVQAWLEGTPSGFVYAPKAHREVTHIRRLKPDGLPMLMAMLRRLRPLDVAGKLGPILLQLPPNLKRDDERLATFLGALPRSHRWAIEFRHDSWHADEVERLLRNYQVAWAAVETEESEAQLRNTADFMYVRLRKSQYSNPHLRIWAERFQQATQQKQDCFVYCKHEDEGSPWVWADELIRLLQAK